MSLPTFSTEEISRDNAINQILASIAMEELSLSHILNAEGEKLQYALGTIDGLETPATLDEILEVNESVRSILESATNFLMLLTNKLSHALGDSGTSGLRDCN